MTDRALPKPAWLGRAVLAVAWAGQHHGASVRPRPPRPPIWRKWRRVNSLPKDGGGVPQIVRMTISRIAQFSGKEVLLRPRSLFNPLARQMGSAKLKKSAGAWRASPPTCWKNARG